MAEETKPKVDWELLALTDQYYTAVAIGPYFVQIAQVCREVVQRADSDRGEHGT